jgi:hypothetical protein
MSHVWNHCVRGYLLAMGMPAYKPARKVKRKAT